MPVATTTVNPDDAVEAAESLFELIDDAVDGYFTYERVIGRPTLEQVNQIALRLARIESEGPACARGAVAVFVLSVVLCIDDRVDKGVATADASGRLINSTMWRTWVGFMQVLNQFKRTRSDAWSPRCDEVTLGAFTIDYQQNRAVGSGEVTFPLAATTVAITGS